MVSGIKNMCVYSAGGEDSSISFHQARIEYSNERQGVAWGRCEERVSRASMGHHTRADDGGMHQTSSR